METGMGIYTVKSHFEHCTVEPETKEAWLSYKQQVRRYLNTIVLI